MLLMKQTSVRFFYIIYIKALATFKMFFLHYKVNHRCARCWHVALQLSGCDVALTPRGKLAIFTELLLLHLSGLPASHADYNYYGG